MASDVARPHGALPDRAGVGLKAEHVREVLDKLPDVGWFEVHAENYMGDGGPPHAYLTAIREHYPISLHGVGLSIGSAGPLDEAHLARLKALCARYEPASFSEHLAWSTHDGVYLNDLLPLPYNELTLTRVAEHIDHVQTTLGRPMLLENPSTYVAFQSTTMGELEFLSELVKRTGCGLLLDVNNVFVSATNHATTPEDYLDAFPIEHVGELHLGGHAEDADETGATLLIDSHDSEIAPEVWALYDRTVARMAALGKPAPSLIEWDSDIPPWTKLAEEAARADAVLTSYRTAQSQDAPNAVAAE